KLTGKEVWRAGTFHSGPTPLIAVTAGGKRQLIVRHNEAVESFDPSTGKSYWAQPLRSLMIGDSVSAPVYSAPYLLTTNYITGSMLLKLDDKSPTASVAWQSKSTDEVDTDILNSQISTPVIKDGFIYGICSYGQLRCIRLTKGERVWETQQLT